MKLLIVVVQLDSHAHFRVFVDGAYAGRLCMREAEFKEFISMHMSQATVEYHLGSIEELAKRAAQTGNVKDLRIYLKARREELSLGTEI